MADQHNSKDRRGSEGSPQRERNFLTFTNDMKEADFKQLVNILSNDQTPETKNNLILAMLGDKQQKELYNSWKDTMVLRRPLNILQIHSYGEDRNALRLLLKKFEDNNIRNEFIEWVTHAYTDSWPEEYIFKEAKKMLTNEGNQEDDDFVKIPPIPLSRTIEPVDVKVKQSLYTTLPALAMKDVDSSKINIPNKGGKAENMQKETDLSTKKNEGTKGTKTDTLQKGTKTETALNLKTALSQRIELDSDEEQEAPEGSREKSKKRKRAIIQKEFKTINILLVGDTGMGKTTFINGLANYLEFNSWKENEAHGPNVLVETKFTLVNNDNKAVTVHAKPSYHTSRNQRHNENLKENGQSVTLEPVNHVLHWTNGNQNYNINIIDTPGMNDTRGTQQDQTNLRKIIEHVNSLGQLNAILILLSASQSRMTSAFTYTLNELLTNFDKESLKNLIFCYTRTRSYAYKPGDGLGALSTYLEEQKRRSGMNINLSRSNVFAFDNECFRYLCLTQQFADCKTAHFDREFEQGWKHNKEELERLFTIISTLPVYKLETSSIPMTSLKNLAASFVKPQKEMSKEYTDCIQEVDEVYNHIKAIEIQIKEHEQNPVRKLEKVFFDAPRTVCKKCNRTCHNNCFYEKIAHQEFATHDITRCAVFKANKNYWVEYICRTCNCPYEDHSHLHYELIETFSKSQLIAGLTKKYNDQNHLLTILQEKREKLKDERWTVLDVAADIRVYIHFKSAIQTPDDFLNRLMTVIQQSKQEAEAGGDGKIYSDLLGIAEYYKKILAEKFDNIQKKESNILTLFEIQARCNELMNLQLFGTHLAVLVDLIPQGEHL